MAYLEGYVSRWDTRAMKDAMSVPAKVVEVGGGSENRYWMHEYLTRAVGEVRLAPNEWLAEMSQGVDDPRWRLVWAIDNELELSGKAMKVVITRKGLENLRVLKLDSKRMTSAFYAALTTHDAMRSLEALYIGPIDERDVKGFMGATSSLENLTHLSFDSHYLSATPSIVRTIGETAAMANVRHLELGKLEFIGPISGGAVSFPSVDVLTLHDIKNFTCPAGGLPPNVRTVRLRDLYWWHMHSSDAVEVPTVLMFIDSPALQDVETLDLSELFEDDTRPERIRAFVTWLVEHSERLGAFGTLVLGPSCPDDARETIQTRYPDLDVV